MARIPDQTRFYRKKGTKKFIPLKGNMLDIDKDYVLLLSIFQNSVEKPGSQNDLRVIVNERKVLKSNLFLNRRNKTNKTNLNPKKYINNTLAGQCPSRLRSRLLIR